MGDLAKAEGRWVREFWRQGKWGSRAPQGPSNGETLRVSEGAALGPEPGTGAEVAFPARSGAEVVCHEQTKPKGHVPHALGRFARMRGAGGPGSGFTKLHAFVRFPKMRSLNCKGLRALRHPRQPCLHHTSILTRWHRSRTSQSEAGLRMQVARF